MGRPPEAIAAEPFAQTGEVLSSTGRRVAETPYTVDSEVHPSKLTQASHKFMYRWRQRLEKWDGFVQRQHDRDPLTAGILPNSGDIKLGVKLAPVLGVAGLIFGGGPGAVAGVGAGLWLGVVINKGREMYRGIRDTIRKYRKIKKFYAK